MLKITLTPQSTHVFTSVFGFPTPKSTSNGVCLLRLQRHFNSVNCGWCTFTRDGWHPRKTFAATTKASLFQVSYDLCITAFYSSRFRAPSLKIFHLKDCRFISYMDFLWIWLFSINNCHFMGVYCAKKVSQYKWT